MIRHNRIVKDQGWPEGKAPHDAVRPRRPFPDYVANDSAGSIGAAAGLCLRHLPPQVFSKRKELQMD